MESIADASMVNRYFPCVVLAETVMLAGCATSGSTTTPEWRPMPADEASLVLYAPGLGAPRVNFERKTKGLRAMERGHWRPALGAYPEAEIILMRFTDHAPSSMTWVREPPLAERVDEWLRTDSIETGTGGKIRNVLGEVEYLRFTRNGATECVFMRQYGDTFSDQRAEKSHGNIMIRGFYCLAPGERLTHRTLRRFMVGVGLKGYEIPAASRDLSLPGEISDSVTEPSVQRRSVRNDAFPYAVRFTSMVFTTSDGHEIADEFDEVSLDHGRLYMYVKWRGLTKDSHVARLQVFDGAGRQVTTSDYDFTPKSTRWSSWWPYTIDPDVDQPGNWRFAVELDGETLVESYLLVTSSTYGPARSGTSAESRETGFRTYQAFDEGSEYKVFARSEGTAWAWRSGATFYTAKGEAMRSCQDRSREVGEPVLCHVYAVGDEVVWEMSEKVREEAVRAYFQ
jgi:hypothetical protein